MAQAQTRRFELHMPPPEAGDGLDQDEEWCEITIEGNRHRIRLHDYAAIYEIPGLYEQLFSELLECCSPDVVCDALGEELTRAGVDPATLRALDFGAGNGMVGERLSGLGVGTVVGVDLLPEARAAALRDRPDVYDDYRALDITAPSDDDREALEGGAFNTLACVAALGFGDVPPVAFVQAFNLISSPGWLAFNLRERFLEEGGFGGLVQRMMREGVIEEHSRRRYTHRRSVTGAPLDYVAIIATKHRDVPLDWAS